MCLDRPLSSFCKTEKSVLPSGSRHDHLTVDDRRSGVDVPRVSRDFSEAIGPIIAAASEYRDDGVFQMDLDAVTVELDFVDPALAVWQGID